MILDELQDLDLITRKWRGYWTEIVVQMETIKAGSTAKTAGIVLGSIDKHKANQQIAFRNHCLKYIRKAKGLEDPHQKNFKKSEGVD